MKVTLNNSTSLNIAADAIRTCWASQEKSDSPFIHCRDCKEPVNKEDCLTACPKCGCEYIDFNTCGPKDRELIHRVGNKFKHASTLEHLTYTFFIEGISRALLQELARHRMASPSVKSTRYTLKELKTEQELPSVALRTFKIDDKTLDILKEEYKKYLVFTGDNTVDIASLMSLCNLQEILKQGVSNDIAKYCLPESYKTSLTWTINARSLQNFIALRSHKSALWEIRDLANAVFNALPEDHKYLFEESLYENQKEEVTISKEELERLKEIESMYTSLCD